MISSLRSLQSFRYTTKHLKHANAIRPVTFRNQSSTLSLLSPATLAKKTIDYFNNYPFVKYSLLLCGVVLGGSLAFESYTKHKKKQLPQILSLPPRVAHTTLPRPVLLQKLKEKRKEVKKGGGGVVYLVGPGGSGKTELVSQYGQWFIQQTLNFTYRFRIKKPTVLYLDGSSEEQLLQTLRETAMCLGLREIKEEKEEGEMVSIARAVQKELTSSKVPWLIIIDNLTLNTTPTFQSLFHSSDLEWNWGAGHVIVTTRDPPSLSAPVITISDRMEEETAMAVLKSLSPSTDFSSVDQDKLTPLLSSSPLVLALAASTINQYTASLSETQGISGLEQYLELLSETSSNQEMTLEETSIKLYMEAAATDQRILHTFDLLGSLSPAHPLPMILIDHHLSSSSFYRLPPLEPPPQSLNSSQPAQDMSLWAQIKMMVPFGKKDPQQTSVLAGFDRIHYLRHCPILSFKKYSRESFELVQVQTQAIHELSDQLLNRTVPYLERRHLQEAEEVFHNTAWFKHYRKFDESATLTKYRSSLPGVGGAGVMTREQFQLSPVALQKSYSQYLHIISHYHLVSSSIISLLKLTDDGFSGKQFSSYIEPHLTHLLNMNGSVSDYDLTMCRYGLAAVTSVSSPESSSVLYHSVLDEQRRLLGSTHPAVARTLTDMAGLSFTKEDVGGARKLLEEAIDIYSYLAPKSVSSETKINHGLALSSLAVVSSHQGERRRSRDLLEQALNLYQSMPESGEVSMYQRRLVASTLTDLSQSYLSLGQIVLAQKYVELAMLAMPNLYPEGSSETVRALTVAGAVYALLGDKRESQRVGQEAGKEKIKVEKQQLLFM